MPSLEGVDDNAPARGFGVRGRSARDRSPQLGESIGLDGYSKYSAGVSGKGATIGVGGLSYRGIGVRGHQLLRHWCTWP